MLREVLDRVKHHWQTDGLKITSPLGKIQIEERFRSLGAVPTDELVEAFSKINGLANGEMDSECFAFWSLDQMISENLNSDWVRDRRYIHFADFLIFSHTYAFRQESRPTVSVYCHYGPEYIVRIADSIEEFFGYYLKTDKRLWPN